MFGLGFGITDCSVTGGGLSSITNFAATTYTGNGTSQSITGLSFQPDLVWIKDRSIIEDHFLMDVNRGANQVLSSNSTMIEMTDATLLTSFDSNGFSLGLGSANLVSNNYVAWCWKAGDTPVSNNDGNITSTVSANPAAGFSVVTYTDNGGANTLGHGLNAAPELLIIKSRNGVDNWLAYMTVIDGSYDLMGLDLNIAKIDSGSPAPTSSVFSGTSTTNNMIAYCFHSVPGYSKIATYTGNASATGPVVTTGFKPRFVLIKRSDSVGDWHILDSERSPANPADKVLLPNSSAAESTIASVLDFTSSGFQIKTASNTFNASGGTYFYMAIA